MGTVSTVTISAVDFSVYALTANANTDATNYFVGSLSSSATAWAAASTDNQNKALVQATRWLDAAVNWSGTKTSDSQPLDWPRDGAACGDTAVTDGTTPDAIAHATFEVAGLLLQDADADASSGEGSNIKRAKAGSAEVEFFSSTLGESEDTAFPPLIHRIIKCYLDGSSYNIEGGNSYGTTDTTDFCEDDFRRSQGFGY
jgi:hypothetical protein